MLQYLSNKKNTLTYLNCIFTYIITHHGLGGFSGLINGLIAAAIGALSMLTSEPTAKSNVKRTRMFVLSLSRHYLHRVFWKCSMCSNVSMNCTCLIVAKTRLIVHENRIRAIKSSGHSMPKTCRKHAKISQNQGLFPCKIRSLTNIAEFKSTLGWRRTPIDVTAGRCLHLQMIFPLLLSLKNCRLGSGLQWFLMTFTWDYILNCSAKWHFPLVHKTE